MSNAAESSQNPLTAFVRAVQTRFTSSGSVEFTNVRYQNIRPLPQVAVDDAVTVATRGTSYEPARRNLFSKFQTGAPGIVYQQGFERDEDDPTKFDGWTFTARGNTSLAGVNQGLAAEGQPLPLHDGVELYHIHWDYTHDAGDTLHPDPNQDNYRLRASSSNLSGLVTHSSTKTYTLEVWIRGSSSVDARLAFAGANSPTLTVSDAWQRLTLARTLTKGVAIRFHVDFWPELYIGSGEAQEVYLGGWRLESHPSAENISEPGERLYPGFARISV